jgi:FdhE protein
MPLVSITEPTRADLMTTAERRWERLLQARPDMEPALDLQRRLLGIVLDVAATIHRHPLPRLSLPPKYLAAKLERGVPVLAGEPIPLPLRLLQPALLQLCDTLAAGGAGDAAGHLHAAIDEGRLDAGSLLAASLSRDQHAIRTGAVHHGLAPDLTWLVAELATGPFAYALQRALFARVDPALAAAQARWTGGYCPCCGSWPALAEVAGRHRVLRCSFCALGWELNTYACIYCGEEEVPFVTAAPDEERKDRRLELCATCQSYLKTIDADELSPFPLVAVADMETMDLDLAAMEHGYGRPPLKQFAGRR